MDERGPAGNPASVARALLALGLRLEIDASAPRPSDVSPVGPGEPLPHLGPGDRVRFPWLDEAHPGLRPGVTVRLELDDLTVVPGRIRHADVASVELTAPVWLGRPIPGGSIVEDARWIPENLRSRLVSSMNGRGDGLALRLLGAGPPGRRVRRVTDSCDAHGLNSDQADVVARGLEAGVTYVLGPPGTGKSRALSSLVCAAVRSGKTVACVAPSNFATDRLLKEICIQLAAAGELEEGTVVRLGSISLHRVASDWAGLVDPWAIALERFGGSDDLSRVRAEHDRLVRRCRVLVTTAARTHLNLLRRSFDLVIMDEAAVAPLPQVFHVATLAERNGSVVVCGDPFQLPVVTRSRHPLAQLLYGQDPFRACGLLHRPPSDEDVAVVRLHTQYRSDPEIANLVAGPMYGGHLQTHESVLRRADSGWLFGGGSLVLVDTSVIPASSRGARSYGNSVHAEVIGTIVQRIRASPNGQSVEIAVLARFRDQVATIRERLDANPLTAVSTVHAMQGGEADIVILDLSACSEHEHLGDYLQDSAPDGVGARILNTAITRARRQLIVVADLPFILGHPQVPRDSMARGLLEILSQTAIQLSADELCGTRPSGPERRGFPCS